MQLQEGKMIGLDRMVGKPPFGGPPLGGFDAVEGRGTPPACLALLRLLGGTPAWERVTANWVNYGWEAWQAVRLVRVSWNLPLDSTGRTTVGKRQGV